MKRSDKIAIERYKKKLELVRSSGTVNAWETEAEKQERIQRAKKDPKFTASYYFPHFATSECADFQIVFAIMVLRNPTFKGFAEWGRALAKSVWCTIIIPFWLWINGEPMYEVIIGNSNKRATQLLEDIRAEFEANPRIIADFGEQHNPGSWEDGFFITKGGFIGQALGTGQSVRGLRVGSKRPTYIVPDDIEIKDTIKNPKRQMEIVKWIKGDLIPTMDGPYRRFIQANNRAYPTMIQTILQERHPKWKIHHVKAYNPVTYKPTWYQKYDDQYFKNIESDIGRLAALAEYNNEPHIEGSIFKEEHIQWGKMPRLDYFKIIVGHWDVAFAGSATSDYNAIKVWGLKDMDFWQIDCFVKRTKMRAAIEWICQFQMSLPSNIIVHWTFEAQFWNDEIARTIFEVEMQYGIKLNIVKVNIPKVKKYDRMLTMHPYYQNGRIYYNIKKKGHNDTQVGLSQLFGLEPGYRTNDDSPDADEQCITRLSKYIYMSRGATKPKTARYERKQRF
jgi:phage terminase large subunit-like protein